MAKHRAYTVRRKRFWFKPGPRHISGPLVEVVVQAIKAAPAHKQDGIRELFREALSPELKKDAA